MNELHDQRAPSRVRPVVNGLAILAVGVVVFVVALWLVGGLVASFLGWSPGGDIGITNGIYIQNRTSQVLHLQMLRSDGWFNLGLAEPYDRPHGDNLAILLYWLDANRCTPGPVVALTDDGHEYARHNTPFCVREQGQTVWVIDEPGASPSI